ncbi:general substrate transporter [Hypoxylon crocopeplum]|nr:general substrate transporter [Hypoxylon crocopeplum]
MSSAPPQPDPGTGPGAMSLPSQWFSSLSHRWFSKKNIIVTFSSIAIALYGYDQGMMSLVNTNQSYLRTMGIPSDSIWVGMIVGIYYIGCIFGAVAASWIADKMGRKSSIIACLAFSMIGDFVMVIDGLSWTSDKTWGGLSLPFMVAGRFILGLGVGGIDAVIPIYSSELSKNDVRGQALAEEFRANIGGLLVAFGLNFLLTWKLGKNSELAWRIPIGFMLLFPVVLFCIVNSLPESPRWLVSKERLDAALESLEDVHGKTKAKELFDELQIAQQQENDEKIGLLDMISGSQFRPTVLTIMGQINQALTGYGAVSVYGPQIFELLGLKVFDAESVTLLNYFLYFLAMSLAVWRIDIDGRRKLMILGSGGLAACFALLTVFGYLSTDYFRNPELPITIMGSITLVIATAIFGTCWLTTVWLIPTEIYPNAARAMGSAISVMVWGLANFAVTFLTPIGFNRLKYWLFAVFAATNVIAGILTWRYSPETGGRSFEENQEFFRLAGSEGIWKVKNVDGGRFLRMPPKGGDAADVEDGNIAKGEESGDENVAGHDSEGHHSEGDDLEGNESRGDGAGDQVARGENADDEPSETTPLLSRTVERA